ncbi:MAG TPA: hypothetical protein VIT68_01385 [Candidatus Gracilibacteria bacterium]
MQKVYIPKRFVVAFVLLSTLLSACVWPQSEDPFERLPEEETVTLEGEIFPFSVSVATRATHRLEKDNRLQMYLASDLVRLSDFEGFQVIVEGIIRKEKMREILWVQNIKIPQDGEDEDLIDPVFHTKEIAFRHPVSWIYTTAPNGVAYFSEDTDVNRIVFFTFEVAPSEKKKEEVDPDIMIANLLGTKTVENKEGGKTREIITLYSNLFAKQYIFTFTSGDRDTEKRKDFKKLLSSFKEGPDNVKAMLKTVQEEQLALELKKVEALKASQVKEVSVEAVAEDTEVVPEETGILDKIFGSKEKAPKKETPPVVAEKEVPQSGVDSSQTAFKNLIDERSFHYKSQYYDFEMDVPWGYWFQNFGAAEGKLAVIGFADNEIGGDRALVDFWLEIVSDVDNSLIPGESMIDGGELEIWFSHSDGKFFHLHGGAAFRDAMKSIQKSISTF